jgi:hypothetical protein
MATIVSLSGLFKTCTQQKTPRMMSGLKFAEDYNESVPGETIGPPKRQFTRVVTISTSWLIRLSAPVAAQLRKAGCRNALPPPGPVWRILRRHRTSCRPRRERSRGRLVPRRAGSCRLTATSSPARDAVGSLIMLFPSTEGWRNKTALDAKPKLWNVFPYMEISFRRFRWPMLRSNRRDACSR